MIRKALYKNRVLLFVSFCLGIVLSSVLFSYIRAVFVPELDKFSISVLKDGTGHGTNDECFIQRINGFQKGDSSDHDRIVCTNDYAVVKVDMTIKPGPARDISFGIYDDKGKVIDGAGNAAGICDALPVGIEVKSKQGNSCVISVERGTSYDISKEVSLFPKQSSGVVRLSDGNGTVYDETKLDIVSAPRVDVVANNNFAYGGKATYMDLNIVSVIKGDYSKEKGFVFPNNDDIGKISLDLSSFPNGTVIGQGRKVVLDDTNKKSFSLQNVDYRTSSEGISVRVKVPKGEFPTVDERVLPYSISVDKTFMARDGRLNNGVGFEPGSGKSADYDTKQVDDGFYRERQPYPNNSWGRLVLSPNVKPEGKIFSEAVMATRSDKFDLWNTANRLSPTVNKTLQVSYPYGKDRIFSDEKIASDTQVWLKTNVLRPVDTQNGVLEICQDLPEYFSPDDSRQPVALQRDRVFPVELVYGSGTCTKPTNISNVPNENSTWVKKIVTLNNIDSTVYVDDEDTADSLVGMLKTPVSIIAPVKSVLDYPDSVYDGQTQTFKSTYYYGGAKSSYEPFFVGLAVRTAPVLNTRDYYGEYDEKTRTVKYGIKSSVDNFSYNTANGRLTVKTHSCLTDVNVEDSNHNARVVSIKQPGRCVDTNRLDTGQEGEIVLEVDDSAIKARTSDSLNLFDILVTGVPSRVMDSDEFSNNELPVSVNGTASVDNGAYNLQDDDNETVVTTKQNVKLQRIYWKNKKYEVSDKMRLVSEVVSGATSNTSVQTILLPNGQNTANTSLTDITHYDDKTTSKLSGDYILSNIVIKDSLPDANVEIVDGNDTVHKLGSIENIGRSITVDKTIGRNTKEVRLVSPSSSSIVFGKVELEFDSSNLSDGDNMVVYNMPVGDLEPSHPTNANLVSQNVSGNVFWDNNNTRIKEDNETNISNITVELHKNTKGKLGSDTLVAHTQTNSNGNYVFSNIKHGKYLLRLSRQGQTLTHTDKYGVVRNVEYTLLPKNIFITTGDERSDIVDVELGENSTDNNFGLLQPKPESKLTKTCEGKSCTVVVENTGNIPLTNVKVSDSMQIRNIRVGYAEQLIGDYDWFWQLDGGVLIARYDDSSMKLKEFYVLTDKMERKDIDLPKGFVPIPLNYRHFVGAIEYKNGVYVPMVAENDLSKYISSTNSNDNIQGYLGKLSYDKANNIISNVEFSKVDSTPVGFGTMYRSLLLPIAYIPGFAEKVYTITPFGLVDYNTGNIVTVENQTTAYLIENRDLVFQTLENGVTYDNFYTYNASTQTLSLIDKHPVNGLVSDKTIDKISFNSGIPGLPLGNSISDSMTIQSLGVSQKGQTELVTLPPSFAGLQILANVTFQNNTNLLGDDLSHAYESPEVFDKFVRSKFNKHLQDKYAITVKKQALSHYQIEPGEKVFFYYDVDVTAVNKPKYHVNTAWVVTDETPRTTPVSKDRKVYDSEDQAQKNISDTDCTKEDDDKDQCDRAIIFIDGSGQPETRVRGKVFYDYNGNGRFDGTDKHLGKVKVMLYINKGNNNFKYATSTFTNIVGDYSFTVEGNKRYYVTTDIVGGQAKQHDVLLQASNNTPNANSVPTYLSNSVFGNKLSTIDGEYKTKVFTTPQGVVNVPDRPFPTLDEPNRVMTPDEEKSYVEHNDLGIMLVDTKVVFEKTSRYAQNGIVPVSPVFNRILDVVYFDVTVPQESSEGLYNISIDDESTGGQVTKELSCPDIRVEPGQTMRCYLEMELSPNEEHYDKATLNGIGTITGKSFTSTAELRTRGENAEPKIMVRKYINDTNWSNFKGLQPSEKTEQGNPSRVNEHPAVITGNTYNSTIKVTNTGPIVLTNVGIINDENEDVVCPDTRLLPGASMLCYGRNTNAPSDVTFDKPVTAFGSAGSIKVYDNDTSLFTRVNKKTVSILKVDGHNTEATCNTRLQGAEFTVRKLAEDGTYDNEVVPVSVTSHGMEAELEVGKSYDIIESVAPTGYSPFPEPVRVTINNDGVLSASNNIVKPVSKDKIADCITDDGTGKVYATFDNYKNGSLPLTGSGQLVFFVILAGFVALSSTVMYRIRK